MNGKKEQEEFTVQTLAERQTAMAERDARTPGPLVLDVNAADNWRKFFMQFEIYLVAKGKDEKPDKLKVNMLLNCAGPEAIEEYSHFVYNEGEGKENYADVCKKFKELCEGARIIKYLRQYAHSHWSIGVFR